MSGIRLILLCSILAFMVSGCAAGYAESRQVWRGPMDSASFARWAGSSPI